MSVISLISQRPEPQRSDFQRSDFRELASRRKIAVTVAGIVLMLVAAAAPCHAQRLVADDTAAAMPDAPSAVVQPAAGAQVAAQQTPTVNTPNGPVSPGTGEPKQTKRILGIIPNFRAVSADQKLPPQSIQAKFISTTQQSFDYSSFILPAVLAGYAQGENSEPQFHQGAAGYGRYFWHQFVDQTSENYWVQAIVPAVTHEDSRYYTLGRGGLVKRGLYAFDRTLITRTDNDKETFNFSEIVGAGAASGISDLYYPSADRTWTKTGQRWLTNVVIDGGTYVFQEFWPNINNAVFHQKD